MSCLRPAVAGVSPAPGSNSIMGKYNKSICGFLVACLSALSFGDRFQVNISTLLGIAKGLFILHF